MDVTESLERAAQLRAQADAEEAAAARATENQSFDDYWAEIRATEKPKVETIRGVRVRVPARLDLKTKDRISRIDMETTDEAEIRDVLGILFGTDPLDQWIEAGMDDEQIAVAMAWALAYAGGKEISWREAHETLLTGKAPERLVKERALEQKTGTSTGASAGTGGPSRGGQRRRGSRRRR